MVSLLLLLVAGCGSGEPEFDLKNPSCQQDFLSWNGGLTWDIMSGGGAGDFDLDPPGKVEQRHFGVYKLDTGDFAYTVSYDPDHYRTESKVTGYGYANPNGDLDIEATVDTTDVDGAKWTTEVRTQRVGCNETEYAIRNGWLTTTTGTFENGVFDYTREYDGGYSSTVEVTGTMNPDLTYDESYDVVDGTLEYQADTSGDGDGNATSTWTQADSSYTVDGTTDYFIDGSVHQQYHYDGSDATYDWDVTTDYEGDGGGTYIDDSSGGSCDIIYSRGVCSYDCGGGQTGAC